MISSCFSACDCCRSLLPDPDNLSFKYIVKNVYDEGVPAPQPPTVVPEGSAEAAAAAAQQPPTVMLESSAEAAAAQQAAAAAGGEQDNQSSDPASTIAAESEIIEPSAIALAAASSSGSRLRRSKSSGINSSWVASRNMVIKRPNESPHDLLARLNTGKLPYGGIVHKSQQQKGDKDKDSNIAVARELSRFVIRS